MHDDSYRTQLNIKRLYILTGGVTTIFWYIESHPSMGKNREEKSEQWRERERERERMCVWKRKKLYDAHQYASLYPVKTLITKKTSKNCNSKHNIGEILGYVGVCSD